MQCTATSILSIDQLGVEQEHNRQLGQNIWIPSNEAIPILFDNSDIAPVDFSWTGDADGAVSVTWSPMIQGSYAIQCYFLILIQSLCKHPKSIKSDEGRTLSVYAFSVDPKVTQFSSNLGQLRRHCSYSLSVVAQNQNTSMDQKLQAANERNEDIKLSKLHLENFTIGDLEGEADPSSPSFLNFLDMDSLVIFLAFVFWALLISTFFKEWGAIKNLQPREISRRPAPYPHNVSDVKVIQRERESVINCRSPDCYSSRIEKFSKMRQFRHSANKMSNRSLNNPATFTRPNDQAPEMTVSNTEIRIEDASDPEFNVI